MQVLESYKYFQLVSPIVESRNLQLGLVGLLLAGSAVWGLANVRSEMGKGGEWTRHLPGAALVAGHTRLGHYGY